MSDKDKAPERVWLTVFDDDKDPQSTMLEWRSPVVRNTQPGDFVATRPHHKVAYVPESKVREAREEVFKECIQAARDDAESAASKAFRIRDRYGEEGHDEEDAEMIASEAEYG